MERVLTSMRAALLLAAAAGPAALSAQEVVQPLPPAGAAKLSDALARVSRNPADILALIDAGEASLSVGDIGAAMGFFGRANEISPANGRIKMGLARTYARSRRPVEALRLFAEAERAGVSRVDMAEDRALAFDLVGDAASAQEFYRVAIANGAGAETKRRLALSQAIAGDRKGFEATLLPLLEAKDLAAFRTRAFGLAILGDTKAAVSISDAMLPAQMASLIKPYLEYMPRLTQAQQAAAGSLGIFPRTASIGTDDPDIAGYAGTRTAGARPAPPAAFPARAYAKPAAPESFPAKPATKQPTIAAPAATAPAQVTAQDERGARQTRRRPDNTGSRQVYDSRTRRMVEAAPPPPPPPPPSPPLPRPVSATNPVQSTPKPSIDSGVAPATAQTPVAKGGELPAVTPAPIARATEPTPIPAATQPKPAQSEPPVRITVLPPAPSLAPETQPAAAPVVVATLPPPAPPPPAPPTSVASAEPEAASLAEAFASFTLPAADASAPAEGAVDITRIAVKREKPKPPAPPPPPPPPPPPKHPARTWVQLATGKDRAALAFDWRRFEKKAEAKLKGKGPFVAKWVQANRLLAGPFKDDKAASDFIKEIKKLGLDSFAFQSAAGEVVEPLK